MRMRPSADPRAPGIYQTLRLGGATAAVDREHAHRRLRRHHPEGPDERADAARRTGTSSSRSSATSTESYTADSVYGFFKNGGTDCWVVRVAHSAPKGELAGLDHAACAEHVQVDDWDKPSLQVRALNEGAWGNDDLVPLRARARRAGAAHARPRHRLRRGARQRRRAASRSARSCASTIARTRDFVVITEVGDKLDQVEHRDAGQPPPPRGRRRRTSR